MKYLKMLMIAACSVKVYSCPMHADETIDNRGKCSKCGMDWKEIIN